MKSLIEYFNCGNISKTKDTFVYRVDKFSDIQNKIIPFFKKYQIQGVKHLDYFNLVSVIELMKNKAHLTKEGLDQIRKIKAGMNKGSLKRKAFSCIISFLLSVDHIDNKSLLVSI